jgi:hypothetical protein
MKELIIRLNVIRNKLYIRMSRFCSYVSRFYGKSYLGWGGKKLRDSNGTCISRYGKSVKYCRFVDIDISVKQVIKN